MQRSKLSILCLVCILLALPAVGCAQTYQKLAPVTEMPQLLRLQEKAETAADRLTRVPVTSANGTKLHIAVHESGTGDNDRVYILIHGVAADSRSWRFIRGGLTDFDVITVDMLGCGQSDAPDAKTLGDEAYDPTCLARCTLQAVQATLDAHRTKSKITLVGHSLGAGSILRMFGHEQLRAQYKDVLDRVDSVVMISPADVCIPDASPTIQSLLDINDAEIAIAHLFGLRQEIAAQAELNSVVNSSAALQAEADRDVEILTDANRRHAMQAMINAAVPTIKKGAIDWPAAENWQAQYRKMNIPSLILWGSRDTALPVSLGYKMQALIPNSRLRVVEPAKHCLMIEQPQICIDLTRSFVHGDLDPTPIAACHVQPLERRPEAIASR